MFRVFFLRHLFPSSAFVSEEDGVEGGRKNGTSAIFSISSTSPVFSSTFIQIKFATGRRMCIEASVPASIYIHEG